MNRSSALFLMIPVLCATTVHAAPEGIPERAMTLELKQASVANLYRLLAEVAGREVVLDTCVSGEVDLLLKNTPLPVVYDVVAQKLGLTYRTENGTIRVGCRNDPARAAVDAAMQKRVSLEVREVALREVLSVLAAEAGLEGVDDSAVKPVTVTLTLKNVRLQTALLAVADSAGHGVVVKDGKLVVETR
jgi:type II secretory pathway component HofQ